MSIECLRLDADELLRDCAVGVEMSSLRRRIDVLKALVQWLRSAQPSDVVTKPQTRLLVRLLLSAVCSPQYLERAWTRSLYDAIECASRSYRCPSFTPMSVTHLAGMVTSAADGAGQLAILRVGQVLIKAAVPTDMSDPVPDWVRKVILLQACVLERIGSRYEESLLHKASKIFRGGLRARPQLLATYLNLLAVEERSSDSLVALSAVVGFSRDLPLYDGDVKPRLLDVYVRDVLLTKGGCSEQYKLASFSPLLDSITETDFSEMVQPVLEKAQKKNPDRVLAAVTSLVKHVQVDLSVHLQGIFLPPVLRQLRSPKEDVREMASQLVAHLARHCRDPGALNTMVSELGAVLSGKSGVLAQWYQRYCLVMGMEGVRESIVSASLTASQMAEIAAHAVDALLPIVEKESHEDTRAIGLGCLTRWVVLLSTIPPKFMRSLLAGIGSTVRPAATAAAGAACRLSDCVHTCAQLSPLVPNLLERIHIASQRSSTFHPEAIYGAKAVIEVMGMDISSGEAIREKIPWQVLTDSTSFLFPAGLLSPQIADAPLSGRAAGPLGPHVCTAICQVIALTARHTAGAGTLPSDPVRAYVKPDLGASCLALMQCAVHPDDEVRQAALNSAQQVCECDHDALIMLLKACQKVVTSASMAEATQVGINLLPSSKEEPRSKPTPPNRFVRALFKILGDCAPGNTLAIAFMLIHHPLVCHSKRGAQSLWNGLARRAYGGADGVNSLLEDPSISIQVSASILQGMQGDLASDRTSAQWALASLGTRCGTSGTHLVTENIVPALLGVLAEDDVRSLSPLDVEIFFTPANVLHTSVASKRKSVATVSKNATRRGKDAEEAEWEERVRAEIGAKGKGQTSVNVVAGKGASDGVEAEEAARLLAEEQAVRNRVRGVRHVANASLAGLSAVFCACPDIGFNCIPAALPVLVPLLGSKLLEPGVQNCVQAVASSASSELSWCTVRVASALRSIQLQPQTAGRSAVVNDCLQCVAGLCFSDAGDKNLKPHALALIFPVVREVLTNPPSMGQCSLALRVVETHANVEDDDVTGISVLRGLRKFMIEAILNVVDRFPQMDPSPDIVLASVCTASALNSSEWSPLLGNTGLLSNESHVRLACLQSIMMMVLEGQVLTGDPLVESRLWLSRFDADVENAELACQLWDARGASLSPGFAVPLMVLVSDSKAHVRDAAARALAGGVLEHPEAGASLLERLFNLYNNNKPLPPSTRNASKLDMEKFFATPVRAGATSTAPVDGGWPARAGVAATLGAMGNALAYGEGSNGDGVHGSFSFLVEHGLADNSTRVRGLMLAAGIAIITAYGEDGVVQFLSPCEIVMAEKPRNNEDAQRFDWRREGVVVFMGSAAKHLDKEDPKVWSIVQTLSRALATPSEAVQIAVSDCLAPLMKTSVVKEQGPGLLKDLLARCVGGRSYGERRGASYGVAAVVKGLGIASIKKHDVISTLEAACKSSNFQGKQGAMCAFECMCMRLGLLFEPYVIVILPHLLKCFGDSSNHVREAAHDCARAIMSKLSAHGVKLILPAILKSLSDPAWRTKQGAIELLGSMAYCAPRQLADCLPMIVPKLTDAFADTHPKVRDSGRKALEDIGSVIRNPEVASLSMTLMGALSDPSKFTRGALEALLACEFMHSIDAPSLALMVPVLQRGLKDRSAEVKRKAALITGNTCSMISEGKDLLPYLSAILPGLKATCVDPIPDVRATAAKALAALVRGMGEDKVGDLVPWLIQTLKADSSSSERSGGAQALSEVLVVMGPDRATSVLGDLLPLAAHPKGAVREGVLWVLCFLPGAMGKDFAHMIPQALPVVLSGLSDEVEAVREVALRSGQVLVLTHGKSHADQLLPALEDGLFDDNWRIRQSSVQLLGDLLYLIGDTKEVVLDEGAADDDVRGSTRAGEAIEEALGLERRNGILASLYLIRSDTSAVVRQSALQVWKTVVPNTPKALREILPLLIAQIINALASGHEDKRTVAGRALGDIVKKLGDQVLPEVVPFLRQGLEAGDENMRQGVCLGLAEIMDCATPRQVEEFIDTLVPAIQDALCDPSPAVREQSAQAFHSLYKAVGVRSIEHVVPSLLRQLGQESGSGGASSARERAVFGLKEVLQLRPRDLLPYLIPKLVSVPISAVHSKALGAVAEVTGGSIHPHLAIIVPAMVEELAHTDCPSGENSSNIEERHDALMQAASTLMSSVQTVGVNWLCNEVTRSMSSKDAKERKWSTWLVEQILRGSKAAFEGRVPQLMKELLQRLVDADHDVLMAVWSALKALNARIPPEDLVPHLTFSRSIIASIVSDARHRKGSAGANEFLLPGVNMPRGLEPLLPMYQQGLMYGSPEVREAAASGIGELVEVTSTKHLQPFLIKITGPLIRIVGDRFPAGVKAAILHTLGLLLSKGGNNLKPFVPQLQTTFVKALGDSSRAVRAQGRTALGQLMQLTTRVDPLISDLASGASSSESAIKATMLQALAEVLERAGSKASASVLEQVIIVLGKVQDDPDEAVRSAAAESAGHSARLLEGLRS